MNLQSAWSAVRRALALVARTPLSEGLSRGGVVFHALREASLIPLWTKARSDLANAVKDGADPGVVAALRRDYKAARTAQLIRDLLAVQPSLTAEQRRELADVVIGGERNAAA